LTGTGIWGILFDCILRCLDGRSALANTRSAEKKVRQERKRRAHNRAQRSRIKTAIKDVLGAANAEAAAPAFKRASALLDRMASRSLIHRNKAARKKSQLAHHVAKLG
jgi:small subunit ribosomal protein S20